MTKLFVLGSEVREKLVMVEMKSRKSAIEEAAELLGCGVELINVIEERKTSSLEKEIFRMGKFRSSLAEIIVLENAIITQWTAFERALEEDAEGVLPTWAIANQLRDLKSSVLSVKELSVPKDCRASLKLRDSYVTKMSEIVAALERVDQSAYIIARLKLASSLERFIPRIDREKKRLLEGMTSSKERALKLDPSLADSIKG